jgi:hypothetical protein
LITHRPKTTHAAGRTAPGLAFAIPFDSLSPVKHGVLEAASRELTRLGEADARGREAAAPRRASRAPEATAACAFVAALF